MGPAVFEKRLRYVSVSQIERFDSTCDGGCERKWYFRYVLGFKETQGRAARLGEQVHAQIEHYLKTGQDTLGPLAASGRRFFPLPMLVKPGLRVEVQIGVPRELMPGGAHGPIDSALTLAGVPVIGRVDVIDERVQHLVEDEDGEAEIVLEPGVIEVNDWKTTKQVADKVDPETGLVVSRGYAKSAAALASTHQMVNYAELVRREAGDGLRGVRVSHTIFQTQDPRLATKRSTVLLPDQVLSASKRSETVVERMKSIAGVSRVDDVPPNYKACDAYSGCQFRDKCPRDPRMVLAELVGGAAAARILRREPESTGETTMSLLDKVNANKKAAAAGAAPTATPATTPDPALAAEREKLLAEEASLRAASAAATASPSILPDDAPLPSAVAALPEGAPAIGCASETQVKLDMDAVATKKFACSCGATVKIKPTKLGDGAYYALVPKHEKPGAAVAAATPEPIAVAPEESRPSPVVAALDAAVSVLQESARTGKSVSSIVEERTQPSLKLYLDCIEDGVVAQRLETYAAEKAEKLAKEMNGGHDIRCAVGDNPLAFGKYRGVLAAVVRAEPPPPGAYLVSSSSEFGMIAFDALFSTAKIFRGVK